MTKQMYQTQYVTQTATKSEDKFSVRILPEFISFPAIYEPRVFPGDDPANAKFSVLIPGEVADGLPKDLLNKLRRRPDGAVTASTRCRPHIELYNPDSLPALIQKLQELNALNKPADTIFRERTYEIEITPYQYNNCYGRGTALSLGKVMLYNKGLEF